MAINNIVRTIFAGIVLTPLLTSCPSPCIEANYNFNVKAKFIPEQESIQIGDSLFLISDFPVQLTDNVSGQSVDYSNAKVIGGTLGLGEISSGNLSGAVDKFDYFAFNGKIYNDKSVPSSASVQQTSYQELNQFYKLKIAIIPKQEGVFLLDVPDAISNGRSNGKNCEKAEFQITLGNSDQHLYYVEEYLKIPPSSQNKRYGYCFKVIKKK